MPFNCNQPILDFSGNVIKKKESVLNDNGKVTLVNTEQDYTYKDLIGTIMQMNDSQAPDPADKKSKIFELLTKLYTEKDPDFTSEQIVLIKEKAGRWASPLELGRLKEFLEPKSETK